MATIGISLVLLSCGTTISDFPIFPQQSRQSESNPRSRAALQLTEEGKHLLEAGKVDDAIGAFERSVNLDASNGQNYYYLAEAWLMKGNVEQAGEFNQLAGLYLESQREWAVRVADQRRRIDAVTGSYE